MASPSQLDDVLTILDEEAAGFIHRGDVTVAGAPGLRLGEGPVTVVSRYELRLREAP